MSSSLFNPSMARPDMQWRSLRIWGAERIAEHLIDKVTFNDAAVVALSAYLPILTEIWEEAARATGCSPQPPVTFTCAGADQFTLELCAKFVSLR
jgi:hypothetical protein